ncbi:MAG: hypothetical protein WC690_10330 [bacterium]
MKRDARRYLVPFLLCFAVSCLCGCKSDHSGAGTSLEDNSAAFKIGGTISGLSGSVVLQNNGADDVSVAADGAFTFATRVANGQGYAVTVKTQPSGQTCTVSQGSGQVSGAAVTDVAVSCAKNLSAIVCVSQRKLDGSDAANTNNTFNIWVVKADGTGLRPLTTATANGAESGWYPPPMVAGRDHGRFFLRQKA